jgi:hypothetical protein
VPARVRGIRAGEHHAPLRHVGAHRRRPAALHGRQRQALLQINTWASTKAEAMALALAIEDALCLASAFAARPNGAARGDHSSEVEPALYGAAQDFEVLGTR